MVRRGPDARCARMRKGRRDGLPSVKLRASATCRTLPERRSLCLRARNGSAVLTGHENRQANGCNGEEDCGPGGKPGEQVGCAARPEGRLRSLAAESSGEIAICPAAAGQHQSERDETRTCNTIIKYRRNSWHLENLVRKKTSGKWVGDSYVRRRGLEPLCQFRR